MAYALKSSHNQYKNRKNALDILINKFIKDSESSEAAYQTEDKTFVDKSVQNLAVNSIIEGYFPKENLVKEMAVKRVNKSLCVILILLITILVASYYCVVSYEIKLNDLSNQTVILNNENEELQNKLDSLKSFNNVDKTLQQANNMMQRAGQVIETQEVTVNSDDVQPKSAKRKLFNYALGF